MRQSRGRRAAGTVALRLRPADKGAGGRFRLQQNFGYNRRMGNGRSPYVWDYDIDEATFADILAGRTQIGRLDQDWAAVRLLEYAPYPEIVRRLGFAQLVAGWPRWRTRVRAQNRRRGLDFLVSWLPEHHPELL